MEIDVQEERERERERHAQYHKEEWRIGCKQGVGKKKIADAECLGVTYLPRKQSNESRN